METHIKVGIAPDFVMSMAQTIYRHSVSILFVDKNKKKHQTIHSDNSQIQVVKQLQTFLNGKNLWLAEKIEWGHFETLIGSLDDSIQRISFHYKLPQLLSSADRRLISSEFQKLMTSFWDSQRPKIQ